MRRLTRTLVATVALMLSPGLALACQMPANAAAMQAEVIALTNLQRKSKGLAPVTRDPALAKAAQAHACDNAATLRMSHQGSDGSALSDRMSRVGYDYREAYENVAAGFVDAPSVMSGWMGSKGHRRNILTGSARDIGVGIATGSNGQVYWAMNLGKR